MNNAVLSNPQFQPSDPVYQFAHNAAIVFAVIGIAILLFILIFYKNPLARISQKIFMGVGMIGIPLVTISLGILIGLDKAKKIEFCGSCHKAMKPYVTDMMDLESESLAAKHFKNLWINHNQCYECHTDYGLLGDFKAKAKGFVDVYRYYFGIWDGSVDSDHPIKNKSCLKCHAIATSYPELDIHRENERDIYADRIFCVDCHTPIHTIKQ